MTLRPEIEAARKKHRALNRKFKKYKPWHTPQFSFHQHPRAFGQAAAAVYARRRRNFLQSPLEHASPAGKPERGQREEGAK